MKRSLVSLVVILVLGISLFVVSRTPKVPYPHASLIIQSPVKGVPQSTEQSQVPTADKSSTIAKNVTFSASETTLNFKIDLGEKVKKKVSMIQSAFAKENNSNQWSNGTTTVQAVVKRADGTVSNDVSVSVTAPDDGQTLSLAVSNKNPLKFSPGRYSLEVGIFENGNEHTITQDFTWGVLALNTDKSIYQPGQKADISIAVLDDGARMVCDADVVLEIKGPDSTVKTLSTKDGSIVVNPSCKEKTIQLKSDYETEYTTGGAGVYTMTLSAKTANGQHSIVDTFEVKDTVPFDVTRVSATRIYPINIYPLTLTVTANQDFSGIISETVPQGFRIFDVDHEQIVVVTRTGTTNEGASYNYKQLSWKENLKKGESVKLMYTYDAPDENPQFYLLGPLSFEAGGNTVFKESRQWQVAVDDTGTGSVVPNGDSAAGWATCTAGSDGNCGTGHYTVVDDGAGTPSTSGFISTGTSGSGGETDTYDMTTFTPTATFKQITSVTVHTYAQSATNANGGTLDTVSVSVFMGGAFQTNQTITPTFNSWADYATTFTGTWTTSDLDAMQVRYIRNVAGSGSPSSKDDDVQIANSYVDVTYTYVSPPPKLTQDGYTFENDDEDQTTGDAVDSNTVQAGTSFTTGKTLTAVKKGERMTVRLQIKNTASASASQKFGLFYDRNDGLFTKVTATDSARTSNGNCSDTNWDCQTVDSSNDTGDYSRIAIDPFGSKWVVEAVITGGTADLRVAKYVGSGGTGCATSAWTCTTIDSTDDTGYDPTITFDKGGNAWIAYGDQTAGTQRVAHYNGGATSGTGCAVNTWTCTTVDSSAVSVGAGNTIALDQDGNPWISSGDATNGKLRVAQYLGGATTGTGCATNTWTCTTVDTLVANDAEYSSIAFDPSGNAWISYWDRTNGNLLVANYLGGATSGTGCDVNTWTCTTVDSGTSGGLYSSIAFDPSGNAWISYLDNFSPTNLKVAVYQGGATSGTGCAVNTWTCTTVESTGHVGNQTSIAFDPNGQAWISYQDVTNGYLRTARYLAGATSGTGCSLNTWTCSSIDTTNAAGEYSSIAFDAMGKPWISYYDTTNHDLRVANLARGGEISAAAGVAGANGDSLAVSHADMTSASDSSNKTDADCLTATTWFNGKWFESQEGSGISVPDGSQTSQCTEIAFTIDTSKAVAGTTYRFVVATDDSPAQSEGKWRGPISVSSNAYPTLTIESSTTTKYSKDAMPHFAACTSSAWGCETIDSSVDGGTFWIGLTFDGGGTPFVSYYDATNTKLKVAQYVGSSGNCSSTKWNCTTIDTNSAANGGNSSMATSPRGNVWVSYRDSTNGTLKVATNYDNPTMSACSASGWDCTTVDANAAQLGYESSIAFDKAGNPWISYRDGTNGDLRVAWFVGSGGNCTDTAWNCTAVDTSATAVGDGTSIAFDANGMAWISYYDNTNTNLKVANYVGSGGNCSSQLFNCQTVDNNNTNGEYTSLAINPTTNLPWVVYYSLASSNVTIVANYVGTGGNCSGNSAWNCTTVTASSPIGSDPSLAFDANGNAWFNYFRWVDASHSDLTVARYVGSGGNCASTAWSCTSVDATVAQIGEYGSNRAFAFDKSGTPWVAYRDDTNTHLKIAKMNLPPINTLSRYKLDSGKAPATESGSCSSTTDNKGYCGVSTDDSDYDSITSGATEQPIYTFAKRFSANSTAPTISWKGRTNVAPSSSGTTGDLTLQIYRFGSTNAWETVTSDTSSSDCSSADCTLSGTPAGTASEYYQADGSNYWSYIRVYQTDNSSSQTLKTGYFNAYVLGPLDHYAVTVVTPQTAGTCSTGTNTVTAQDVDNNTLTSDTSTVNMTNSGSGITFYTASNCLSSTTQYTLSSGVANIYYKTNKAQSFTITATKNSSTETGTSSSVTVNPGSQTRLVITLPSETFTAGTGNSGSVDTQTAGTPFNITSITATDDYFNIITGYSGSKTLSYSGPSGSPTYTTAVNFTSGQSTTTLTTTLDTVETTNITVTDGGSYGYASSSLTVQPGAGTSSVSVTHGVSFGSGVNFH